MSAPRANETRHKRIAMRAWHRGTKEMDLILGRFAEAHLATLAPDQLDQFEALMEQNDHDLYQWVTGRVAAQAPFAALIERIARHAGAR